MALIRLKALRFVFGAISPAPLQVDSKRHGRQSPTGSGVKQFQPQLPAKETFVPRQRKRLAQAHSDEEAPNGLGVFGFLAFAIMISQTQLSVAQTFQWPVDSPQFSGNSYAT